MKRRDFIKKSMQAGALAGAAMTFGGYSKLFASPEYISSSTYDLAAIKGGMPDKMFDKAIKTLGGIKNFVKPNQTVVVKPNIGWDVSPERAGNTNPLLVRRIIEHCYQAGAKKVYVFDNTCNNWIKCYKNSGIEKMVKEAKGQMVPGNAEKYYQKVAVKNGKRLTETQVHELILESDVFINVPILKHHSSADLTISIKNLMGIVWDRRYWHKNDLHQCIADYSTFYRQPDLNIVDAYRIMFRNGPRGVSKGDVKVMKTQLISKDMVAVDAAAAKLLGKKPNEIEYIKLANSMGVGEMDLNKLKIARLSM